MAISMTKFEFVGKVFVLFGRKDEDLMAAYMRALDVKFLVDWERFYYDILQTADKRVLPMPKWFLEEAKNYKVLPEEKSENEGKLLRMELKNGRVYDFTVCGFADTNLEGIKKKLGDNIKRVTLYNRGITALEVDCGRVKENEYKVLL